MKERMRAEMEVPEQLLALADPVSIRGEIRSYLAAELPILPDGFTINETRNPARMSRVFWAEAELEYEEVDDTVGSYDGFSIIDLLQNKITELGRQVEDDIKYHRWQPNWDWREPEVT